MGKPEKICLIIFSLFIIAGVSYQIYGDDPFTTEYAADPNYYQMLQDVDHIQRICQCTTGCAESIAEMLYENGIKPGITITTNEAYLEPEIYIEEQDGTTWTANICRELDYAVLTGLRPTNKPDWYPKTSWNIGR